MKVGIRHIRLQHEVIEANTQNVAKLKLQFIYRVAKTLRLSPDDPIVLQIVQAIRKGVKILKTNDFKLLNLSSIIFTNYNIEIIR